VYTTLRFSIKIKTNDFQNYYFIKDSMLYPKVNITITKQTKKSLNYYKINVLAYFAKFSIPVWLVIDSIQ
jgi:hypothetical protein